MKFWQTDIIFQLYKNNPPKVYTLHTNDTATAKDVTKYWRNTFDYMGKNGILKMQIQEITEKEWFERADSWKHPCSHEEWYDFFQAQKFNKITLDKFNFVWYNSYCSKNKLLV